MSGPVLVAGCTDQLTCPGGVPAGLAAGRVGAPAAAVDAGAAAAAGHAGDAGDASAAGATAAAPATADTADTADIRRKPAQIRPRARLGVGRVLIAQSPGRI
jgi:hypothetical protein